MNRYVRGSVWWCDLPKRGAADSHCQYGRRPVIVLTHTEFNRISSVITVIPCTSKNVDKQYINRVKLNFGDNSYAMIDQILTVDKKDLNDFQGILEDTEMSAVEASVVEHLLKGYSSDITLYEDKPEPSVIASGTYKGMTAVEKFNAKYNRDVVEIAPIKQCTIWTKELKLKLVNAVDEAKADSSLWDDVLKNFSLKNTKTALTYAAKFRRDLQNV